MVKLNKNSYIIKAFKAVKNRYKAITSNILYVTIPEGEYQESYLHLFGFKMSLGYKKYWENNYLEKFARYEK